MKITFSIEGFTPQESAFANTRWLLETATREIQCPAELVQEVAVADEANFGSEIQRIAPGMPYTNNEHYQAVAKTISISTKNGHTPSAIVLRDFILGGALTAMQKEFADRSTDDQRHIYTVWHEAAHARDNGQRDRDNTPDKITDPFGRFKVQHVADFFRGAVLSETAACRLAALAYSQGLYDLESEHDNRVIEKNITALISSAKAYSGHVDDLYQLAFNAAQTFWLPFVQYGKCIAHLYGNGSLAPALTIWPGAPDEAEAVVMEYGTLLRALFASYPKTPPEFAGQLFSLWERLAGIYGFRFVSDQQGGDGVYWKLSA